MLSRNVKIAALISSVLLLLILKYIIDQNSEALPQILQMMAGVSLPVAAGSAVVGFFSLLGTFRDAEKSALSHLTQRISENPARNFFLGFLMAAYFSLVRPRLASNVPFLPYMEWVAIALTVYMMYSRTKTSTGGLYVNSEDLGWKRHAQEVKRETGRDLIQVTSFMERFVEHGVKEPLLVHLTLHLQRLGETEESILKTLRPLIYFEEQKTLFSVFPWTKRKVAVRNKKAREDTLKTILRKINKL